MKFSSFVPRALASALLACSLAVAAPAPASGSRPFRLHEVDGRACDAGSKQLTGHIDVTDEKSLFFWYAESRKSPSKAPLLIWLQGGPGSSSMYGLFSINGPCRVNLAGDGTTRNAYGWTEFANVLYIDNPAGVGLSLNTGTSNTSIVGDLETTSSDLSVFLSTFVTSVRPSLKRRSIIVAGESFGGHYVPHFLSHYDKNAKAGKPGYCKLNFAGAVLGNAAVESASDMLGFYDLACSFDPLATGFKEQIFDQATCDSLKPLIPECKKQRAACLTDGPANNGNWSACGAIFADENSPCASLYGNYSGYVYDARFSHCNMSQPLNDGVSCPFDYRGATSKYLQNPATLNLLSLDPKQYHFEVSNDTINSAWIYDHTDFARPTTSELSYVLREMKDTKVLFYNGNSDALMTTAGQKMMLEDLVPWGGQDAFKRKPMKEWLYEDDKGIERVGGTGKAYKALQFTTINQAGHMVAADQPQAALHVLKAWAEGLKL